MKKSYEIAVLAQLYCPGSAGYNAQRRFMRLLKSERALWQKLLELDYRPYRRTFTPKQYNAIIETLGEPDDTMAGIY